MGEFSAVLRFEQKQKEISQEVKMITEWEDLEGKTIKEVVPSPVDEGYILFFTDGDYAHVTGRGRRDIQRALANPLQR